MSRAATSRPEAGSVDERPVVLSRRPLVGGLQRYFFHSELPLTSLLFLLPLLAFYEVGTQLWASDVSRHTETRVLAFNLVAQFMQWFGASGRYLPALAVVSILLSWHLMRGDPWRPQGATACGMAVESVVLALPLLVASNLIGYYLPLASPVTTGHGADPALMAAGLPPAASTGTLLRSGIVLAIGAGIYEELVFRLFLFTVLSIVLTDCLGLRPGRTALAMVLGSAVLFAAYHYWSPLSPPFRWSDGIFRTFAGAYFGVLMLWRGFGITAGCHIAYDVLFFCLHALARQ